MKGPCLHIFIEVFEKRIGVVRLKKRLEFKFLTKKLNKARLPRTDVSRNGDVTRGHNWTMSVANTQLEAFQELMHMHEEPGSS